MLLDVTLYVQPYCNTPFWEASNSNLPCAPAETNKTEHGCHKLFTYLTFFHTPLNLLHHL